MGANWQETPADLTYGDGDRGTPGCPNDGCPLDYTPIYDIQYTTDPDGDSPLVGQVVTTEGIVTARFQYGYFIEDPAGGAWNGLWVHDTTNTPDRGDRVRITGEVAEYHGLTELDNLTAYQVESGGNPLPDPVVLPTGDVSQEQWEGVLVRVENVTVVNADLGYGEWSVDDGSGEVIIDDKGDYSYTPTEGDELRSITGPLDYHHGAFKIQPRDDADIVLPAGPAPVLISEVQTGGATGSDEFIELYNPSDSDSFNLKGYRLVYRSASGTTDYLRYEWTEDTFIPPYGHYLLVNESGYDGDVPGDATFSQGLSGTGGGLALRNPDGEIVDSVGWGTASNDFVEGSPAPAPPANQSIERLPGGDEGNGQDTDDNSADFQVIDPPNPQNTNSPSTPSLVIPIGEARTRPLGSEVIVEGTVTVPPGTYNKGFAIQDETGGIYVYNDGGLLPYGLGDVLRVKGPLTEYRGLLEITPAEADVTLVGSAPVPDPRPYHTGEISEATEGWLVVISGTVTGVSDSSFTVDDGTGPATVYIDPDTGIEITDLEPGTFAQVVGFSSQYDPSAPYDSGYQVMPRFQEDLTFTVVPVYQGDCPAPAPLSTGPTVLINQVLYDTWEHGHEEAGEAVQLWNPNDAAVDLSGWALTDNEGTATFPAGVTIPAQGTLWVAKDGDDFTASFGFAPDLTYAEMTVSGTLQLDNVADEVVLLDGTGAVVDALVIEDGCAQEQSGWADDHGVFPYLFASYVPDDGQILYRKLDEATGLPVADTDTAADWAQDPNDPTLGRHVRYPGWDLEQFFFPAQADQTATTKLLVAPDNIYEGVAGLIDSAQSTIDIELYLFTNPYLADHLFAAMDRGVQVRALFEGEVYGAPGGTYDDVRWVAQGIYERGGEVYWWRDAPDGHPDRYNNVHQKFLIVDGTWAFISSENLTQGSMPADDKGNGTYGNRGAAIITNAPVVVQRLQEVFAADLDPDHHGDVVPHNPAPYPDGDAPPEGYVPEYEGDREGYTPVKPEPLTLEGQATFEVVQSPESSLRTSDALLGMVARADAGDVVLVEQQYEYLTWGPEGEEMTNPRLNAYIEAARRGATVRVLLNGAYGLEQNIETRDYLNDLAAAEGLDLEARLGTPTSGISGTETITKPIHNKMVLVYDGESGGWVHVGSINGSENASRYNREVALQIGSTEAYVYYADVFHHDWLAAGGEPFPYAPPEAAFTPSATEVVRGDPITFTNESTGSPPLSYRWDFGDGEFSDEESPTHVYQHPGVYTVTLTVSNPLGTDQAQAVITVLPLVEPLEEWRIRAAVIQWFPLRDGQGGFIALARLELPPGYRREDLGDEMTLELTIGGQTGSDTVRLIKRRRVWRYHHRHGDGEGDGLDLSHVVIFWRNDRKAPLVQLMGRFNLPGAGWWTHPAEATFGIQFPVVTPGLADLVAGETTVAFRVLGFRWVYQAGMPRIPRPRPLR
ncbi:MAG: PKD domain-containing protein [Chloroflexi bacterium]|nr:MAG: PKD domain-containing protein [Chloroflexota bacterium]